jgi:hypothetical protein
MRAVDARLDLLKSNRSAMPTALASPAASAFGPNKEAAATTPSVPRKTARRL